MRLLTTGEVRRLWDPPISEGRIWQQVRSSAIRPSTLVSGRFLWSESEIRQLADLLGLPIPISSAITSTTSKEKVHAIVR